MSDGQLYLFDSSYFEENSNHDSNACSSAAEELLMLVIKRMGRYISACDRKRIILSSLYTLHRNTDEMIFRNVLNDYIKDLDLRSYDWDDYYAARKSSRRRK